MVELSSSDDSTTIALLQIHEGLARIDPITSEPVPAIAKSWDISKDGKVYTFHLRKDAKFHNGRGIKAEDFKYSFERLMNPKEGALNTTALKSVVGVEEYQKGEAREISGIKVLDDYTLQITLKSLDIGLLYGLAIAQRSCQVVPKEEVERLDEDFGRCPVGAGPFKFVSWIGNEITLEAFDDYYDGRPYLDKVVIKAGSESAANQVAFEAKELDYNMVTITQYEDYLKRYGKLLIEVPEFWTRVIGFNMDCPLFKDKRVRQALNYAIDKETLVEKYLKGKAYPTTGYFPLSLSSYNPTLKGYEYNPKKAKELLKEAGYGEGLTIEIIGIGNLSYGIPVVEAIMPYLEAVGVKVKPVQLENAAVIKRVNEKDFEAFTNSLGGIPDPFMYIGKYRSCVSREALNQMGYNNPAFDAVMELAERETDFETRMDLLRAAEAIFVEDAPCIFLNYNKAVMVHRPWVHGLQPVARELTFQLLGKVWVDDSSPRAGK